MIYEGYDDDLVFYATTSVIPHPYSIIERFAFPALLEFIPRSLGLFVLLVSF